MKVLLIMPANCDVIHAVSLPLGIISIATYLKQHGIEARICDLSVRRTSLKKVVDEFRPDIAGLSFASVKSIDGVLKVSKYLRKKQIPIVWGGPFCDVAETKHFFDTGLVDILSFREGEETWLELVRALEAGADLSGVKGIAYLKDGAIVKTPERPFLDPALLPKLDYSFVNVPQYFTYLYGCKKLLYVYLSKGCPAGCTFCYNYASHCSVRQRRSLADFMEELTELVTVYGADGFYLADELAFVNDRELYELCGAIRASGLQFHWGCQQRVGTLSPAALREAYDCGCRWIVYGIESGNREMLKKIRKNIPYDQIEPTFAACDEIGFISIANFIIGLPDETPEQLQDSIDLAKRLRSTQNTFVKYIAAPNLLDAHIRKKEGKPYVEYRKLKDYEQMDFFSTTNNLTGTPLKELNVIQSYFLIRAIFRKDYNEARDYDLFFKLLVTFFQRLATLDLLLGTKALFEIVSDFLRFLADGLLHPRIVKKYRLRD